MTPNQVALTWLLGDPHDYTMLITACQPVFPPFSHLLSSLQAQPMIKCDLS